MENRVLLCFFISSNFWRYIYLYSGLDLSRSAVMMDLSMVFWTAAFMPLMLSMTASSSATSRSGLSSLPPSCSALIWTYIISQEIHIISGRGGLEIALFGYPTKLDITLDVRPDIRPGVRFVFLYNLQIEHNIVDTQWVNFHVNCRFGSIRE